MEPAKNHIRIVKVNNQPVIRGTDITVSQILTDIAQGASPVQILERFPVLTPADISATLKYAAAVIDDLSFEPDSAGSETPVGTSEDINVVPAPPVTPVFSNQVLVVDDLAPNRRLTELMFLGTEFDLSLVASGEEALALAQQEPPLMVLSDIQMPGMSGFELCEQLKADARTKNVAIILITAHHANVKKISQGLDLGADDYIIRPFHRDELLARVRAVARLRRAEIEARHHAALVERRNQELELLSSLALVVGSSATEGTPLEQLFIPSLQQLPQLLDAEAIALLLPDMYRTQVFTSIVTRDGQSAVIPVPVHEEQELTPLRIQELVPDILNQALAGTASPANGAPSRNGALNISPAPGKDRPAIRSIPMADRWSTVGALAVLNKYEGAFSTSDWMLLNSVVGMITIVIENVRLWQNVQQQVENLTLLNQVGQTLNSTLDLEKLLSTTTQLVQASLDARAASVWLLDDARQELVLMASSGPNAEIVTGFRLPVDCGIAGYVAQTGHPYFCADFKQDAHHFSDVADVSHYTPGSVLCVPLLSQDRILGVVQAMRNEVNGFRPADLQLFESVASNISVAVQNANLFKEVCAFNQQLEEMVAERTRELREEQEKTLAILAGMADGLLVLDAKQCILTANTVAEAMLNFRLHDMLGHPIPSESQSHPLWRYINTITSGAEFAPDASIDLPAPLQPGEVLSIQARASQIRDETGKKIGTVIVLRDITALKEVERMKARFMAGVTHELKTPLAVLKMHADNLLTYYGRLPDQKRKELLGAMQKQIKLLEQLVEGILDLSRLDSGAVEIEFRKINLCDLIAQVLEGIRPLAEAKSLSLHWERSANSIAVMGDVSQIERVIRNLLDNAIKYTPAGGRIQIAVTSEHTAAGNCVEMRVDDTGIGIPPEAQTRVFERFYRVDPSHTVPGTGLGLSIVKEIVEAHGGTIRVESTVGQGSSFRVKLPGLKFANRA
ncbi:MAG: GAF domain-containing protein [Anaerolineae bacterium]|nr:GAF domain-containing protein [Anaerolineae bacterium]